MHPVLFQLGALPLTSYGVGLALAFAIGTGVAMRRARTAGLDAEHVLEAAMLILVSALVGARLFHVWMNPAEFEGVSWGSALSPFAPDGAVAGVVGLSVMGGLPAALGAAFLFLRWRADDGWALMDVMAPSVALGAGITRIGCFLNGCCFGRVCDWPWAVRFPADSLPGLTLPGAMLHPSQLYQAAAGFGLFALLLLYARTSPPKGSIVAGLVAGMGLQRLIAEWFRHHDAHEVAVHVGALELTTYQLVAAGLVLTGVALWSRAGQHAVEPREQTAGRRRTA